MKRKLINRAFSVLVAVARVRWLQTQNKWHNRLERRGATNTVRLANIAEGTHDGNITKAVDAIITERFLLAKGGSAADRVAVCGAADTPIGVITDEAAQYYLTVQSGILPAAYMSELFFTQVYNKFLKGRNGPAALTFMLGFDSAPIQAEKSLYDLAQWVRGQPKLAAALANMSSVEFAGAYRAEQIAGVDEETWSGFRQRFAAHMARFGDAIYDLDFAKAVPAEDPASLLETLKFFLRGEAPDPYVRQEAAAAAREQAVQTMLRRLHGLRLSLFRWLVGWAQRFAPLREDALAAAGLGWPVLRRMLREIGRRLTEASAINTPDDVFWLTLDDLQEAATALDAGQAQANYRTVIAERWALSSPVWEPVANRVVCSDSSLECSEPPKINLI